MGKLGRKPSYASWLARAGVLTTITALAARMARDPVRSCKEHLLLGQVDEGGDGFVPSGVVLITRRAVDAGADSDESLCARARRSGGLDEQAPPRPQSIRCHSCLDDVPGP